MRKTFSKKIFASLLSVVVLGCGIFWFVTAVQAASGTPDLGISYGAEIGLGSADIRLTIARIVRVALGLLGIVAVVLVIYAGFLWMTAGGDEEKIGTAKKILINATIGIAIILSSYAIVSFVMSRLIEATTGVPAHCSNGIKDTDVTPPEEGVDCGGACRSCAVSPNVPYLPTNSLFVVGMPSSGQICTRSFHPIITFNVNVSSTSVVGNIVLEKEGGEVAAGSWEYSGNRQNVLVFNPTGSCAPASAGNDCLDANATYTLRFINLNNIKALSARPDGTYLSLVGCRKAGTITERNCEGVQIVTGDRADAFAPTIDFRSPAEGASLRLGEVVNVLTKYVDDLGAQNASLYEGANLIDTKNFIGCNAQGNADFIWPTGLLSKGPHIITAVVNDWSAKSGTRDRTFILRPDHCFNDVKDADEVLVDCGGADCGTCAEGVCVQNSDCASGWCQAGRCVARMFISDFTPKSGANETYVTIAGRYFGNTPGKVWFAANTISRGTNLLRNPNLDGWDGANRVPADWNISSGGDTTYGNLYTYTDALSMIKGVNNVTNNDYVVASQYVFNVIEASSSIGYIGSVDAKLGHYNNPEASLFLTITSQVTPPFEGAGDYLWNFDTQTWVAMDESNNSVPLRFNTSYVKMFTDVGAEYKKYSYEIPNNKGFTVNYIWGFKPRFSRSDIVLDNFELKPTADVNQTSGYEARLAPCAGAWTDSQIIVEAPGGIPSGPIAVETSGTPAWKDFTNDDYGPFLPDFTVTDVVHPGICSVNPASGFPNSQVVISGKNFGNAINNNTDKVMFGDLNATVLANDWTNTSIRTKVPFSEGRGVGIKVLNNGIESNSLRFNILGTEASANAPRITDISPASGAAGSYITIKGVNFGNVTGYVWFKKIGAAGDTIMGDMDNFPAECAAVLWKNDQVVVKFPSGRGDVGSNYSVQLVNLEDINQQAVSALDSNIKFSLTEGLPQPGICKIDPASGPIPMLSGDVKIVGEYFGDNPDVYFWKSGASVTDITGRSKADKINVVDVSGGKKITVKPFSDTETGPVVLYRPASVGGDNMTRVVGYWKLDGNFSNAISGASASANISGGSFAAGKYGGGLSMSSAPDRLNLNIPNGDVAFAGFGLEFWMKYNFLGLRSILTPPAGNINIGEGFLSMTQISNNQIFFGYQVKTGQNNWQNYGSRTFTVPPDIDLTRWNHFAYNLENRFLTLYINGRRMPETATLANGVSIKVKTIAFANINGYVDEIALYGRQMDYGADILSHYQRRINFNSAFAPAISNALNFSVYNCKNNNNQCQAGYNCCGNGQCQASVCEGDLLSTGYLWRFCTKDIPAVPRVLERCVDSADSLPTPSPSFLHSRDAASGTCRTALGIVEFTASIDPTTVTSASVKAFKCASIQDNQCNNPEAVTLNANTFILKTANTNADYLQIQPEVLRWEPFTNYQIVITDGIRTLQQGDIPAMSLAKDKPCSNVANSAYCYTFKTGDGDCRLRDVIISPYEFLTKVLESPIQRHPGDMASGPLVYRGLGLSAQKCIAMDILHGYDWNWSVDNRGGNYASINGATNEFTAKANALANTVGERNLSAEPQYSVNVQAHVTKAAIGNVPAEDKTGYSPLKIDLQNPEVVGYWPNCLEACTNSQVGMKFNTTMSSNMRLGNIFSNLSSEAVRLYKCNDENCINTIQVNTAPSARPRFDVDRMTLVVASGGLDPNAIYLVKISAPSTTMDVPQLGSGTNASNPAVFGAPFDKEFVWRFKTKSIPCQISRVDVEPKLFSALMIGDKGLFKAQPFSSPDSCSAIGQRLDPYSVGWTWNSTAPLVASVQSFSTVGSNRYCTSNCIRKGSDIPLSAAATSPVCGDSRIEAGEDCDPPSSATGCTLNCLKPGTYTGSNPQIAGQPEQASICGNGTTGIGEACDRGIISDPRNASSSYNCTERCLHTGTALSSLWCNQNVQNRGGYTLEQFKVACDSSLSQCGNGLQEPDEDPGCDAGAAALNNCNQYCLLRDGDSAVDNANGAINCSVGQGVALPEGCVDNHRHMGSSFFYSTPSFCGDGIVGVGEDAYCENTNFFTNINSQRRVGLYDPWVLATAVGKGVVDDTVSPPAQRTNIRASTSNNTDGGAVKTGSGEFRINCGFTSDDQCPEGQGVAEDSCCYARPKVLGVYPGSTSTQETGVCPNTTIEVEFSEYMDATTIPGNLLIAKGQDLAQCPSGTIKVNLLSYDSGTGAGSWMVKIFHKISNFIRSIFFSDASAGVLEANTWCAGADAGVPTMYYDPVGKMTRATITLTKPLATTSLYAIILKDGLKDLRGVSIGSSALGITGGTEIKKCIQNNNACSADSDCPTTMVPAMPYRTQSDGDDFVFYAPPERNQEICDSNECPQADICLRIESYGSPVAGVCPSDYPVLYDGECSRFIFRDGGPFFYFDDGRDRLTNECTANEQHILQTDATNAISAVQRHSCQSVGFHDNWAFSTAGDICAVRSAAIDPAELRFNRPNVSSTLNAVALGELGKRIQPIPGYYAWEWLWVPVNNPYLQIPNSTSSLIVVTSTNRSGELDVLAQANMTADRYTNTSGVVATGKSHIVVTMCENPWPTFLPYEDKENNDDNFDVVNGFDGNALPPSEQGRYFNFGTYYCADNGVGGNTADDLPFLKPAVQVTSAVLGNPAVTSTPMKRFIFTNDKNSDAIGVQIFRNPNHLTVQDWFERDKAAGGAGFVGNLQSIKIAGYDAGTNGNNVYVDALNVAEGANRNLYNNIYLFSINADAKEETKKVFQQLIANLKFNVNLNNYRYCGATNDLPNSSRTCSNDLDCDVNQVCAASVDKLKNNYARLKSLGALEDYLNFYAESHAGKYPALTEGTYLSGQTVSTWPSWSALGTALRVAAPVDPINKLGMAGTCASSTNIFCTTNAECPLIPPSATSTESCVLHNATTGWSDVNNRYSFACASSSFAYRYIFSTSTGFTVRARFERPFDDPNNQSIANWQSGFVNSFLNSPAKFIIDDDSGICRQDQEISTIISGYCGDGKINLDRNLNRMEACDPPGMERFGACELRCSVSKEGCTGEFSQCSGRAGFCLYYSPVSVCTGSCDAWVASTTLPGGWIDCTRLNKCGNSVVDPGEQCDNGVLNGRPGNRCGENCRYATEYCGNGVVNSPDEVCDWKLPGPVPPLGGFIHDSGKCSNVSGKIRDCNSDNDCKVCNGDSSLFCRVDNDCAGALQGKCVVSGSNCSSNADCGGHCDGMNPMISHCKTDMDCGDAFYNPETGESSFTRCIKGDNICEKTCGSAPQNSCAASPLYTSSSPLTIVNIGSKIRYSGVQKEKSCNWDCKSFGPYCGDGIVQTEFREECDGSQTCSIGTVAGERVCSSECKMLTPVAGWWRFDTGSIGFDSGTRYGLSASGCGDHCPERVTGRVGNAADFDGIKQYLEIPHQNIFNSEQFTLEAWVKPSGISGSSVGIFEKGYYNLQSGLVLLLDKYQDGWFPHFLAFDPRVGMHNNDLFVLEKLPFNVWTHLAVVYADDAAILYVNGEMKERTAGGGISHNNRNLTIGRAVSDDGQAQKYFKGQLDELSYYDRALTLAEIKDHYQDQNGWFCSSTVRYYGTVQTVVAGCGDGKVDPNEACDNGAGNGLPCTPPEYGRDRDACTYCSADCKNIVSISPSKVCGDARIDTINSATGVKESCDFEGIRIWSSLASSATFPDFIADRGGYLVKTCAESSIGNNLQYFKGERKCEADCLAFMPECILCGQDEENGVEVEGTIINVVRPNLGYNTGIRSNPPGCGQKTFNLSIGQSNLCTGANNGLGILNYKFENVSSNPVCSAGDPAYALKVFDTNAYAAGHALTFPLIITANPTTWQYDVVLSPKITQPNDIRIVVSWTGSGFDQYFTPGFLIRGSDGVFEYAEGGKMIDSTLVPSLPSNQDYFNSGNETKERFGIWHHVKIATSSDSHHVRTYTLNTANAWESADQTMASLNTAAITRDIGASVLKSMANGTYAFFIYAPNGSIQSTRSNLRVDVYLSDASNPGAFSAPSATYYLSAAKRSDYAQASYWHVFNVRSMSLAGSVEDTVVKLEDVLLNGEREILNNGKIVTSPQDFRMTQ